MGVFTRYPRRSEYLLLATQKVLQQKFFGWYDMVFISFLCFGRLWLHRCSGALCCATTTKLFQDHVKGTFWCVLSSKTSSCAFECFDVSTIQNNVDNATEITLQLAKTAELWSIFGQVISNASWMLKWLGCQQHTNFIWYRTHIKTPKRVAGWSWWWPISSQASWILEY